MDELKEQICEILFKRSEYTRISEMNGLHQLHEREFDNVAEEMLGLFEQRPETHPHETIVMRESDKAINWELHDKEIVGHTFDGNGVYIIRKLHQSDYKYVLFWRDDRKYEVIKLKESDHLLSVMNWCVEHWQLSDDVDA